MPKSYRSRRELKDRREFTYGEIWKVKDELIRLLPSDRLDEVRHLYPSRTVVIVQNCLENNDDESLLIRVAPLTSVARFRDRFDVMLSPKEDGVQMKCWAQVQLTQPMLKRDMFEKIAEISPEKKEEIALVKLGLLGIDLLKGQLHVTLATKPS